MKGIVGEETELRDELREIRALLEERTIARLEKVRLEPGDVLIVTVPGLISEEAAQRLREATKRAFPGVKVIVFGDGITVSVVSPSEPHYRTARGPLPP